MFNILLPIDYSDYSEKALQYAINFVADKGAKITMLNCFQPLVTDKSSQDVRQAKVDRIKRYIEEFVDQHPQLKKEDIKITYRAEAGEAAEEIEKISQEQGIDLIVMGTKGGDENEAQFGSVAAAVIKNGKCPVLAVPESATYRSVKKIMYAVDYEDVQEKSIKMLEDFAQKQDAEVILLHVNPTEHYFEEEKYRNYLDTMRKVSEYDKLRFEFVQNEDIAAAIDSFIADHNIDLLAMLTRDYHLIEKVYAKSLTKKMLFHTQIPLLAFHE